MKRRLFKLVVFLLLGAIVNVAVAWWCELSTTLTVTYGEEKLAQDEATWPSYLHDTNWPTPTFANRHRVQGVGISFTLITSSRGTYAELRSLGTDELFTLAVVECGWPLRSLEVHMHFVLGSHQDARMEEALDQAGWYRGLTVPAFEDGKLRRAFR